MKKFNSLLVVLLLMLASFTAGVEYPRGDTNLDGVVNISDVTCLIDYLLNGTWPDEPVTPPEEHEWVDLGLPSGTLWATCNVGANSPEEYGDYFAWGETEPKSDYSWSNYKWCSGSYDYMTKYCTNSDYGMVDGKNELDPEDDAAYVNWDSSWRMPTYDQMTELETECTWTWTTLNDVNGYLVTGPNRNTLFLPAAEYFWGSSLQDANEHGSYWSNRVHWGYSGSAICLEFNSEKVEQYCLDRFVGKSVRAVRVSE